MWPHPNSTHHWHSMHRHIPASLFILRLQTNTNSPSETERSYNMIRHVQLDNQKVKRLRLRIDKLLLNPFSNFNLDSIFSKLSESINAKLPKCLWVYESQRYLSDWFIQTQLKQASTSLLRTSSWGPQKGNWIDKFDKQIRLKNMMSSVQ